MGYSGLSGACAVGIVALARWTRLVARRERYNRFDLAPTSGVFSVAMARNSVTPDALASSLVKFWPILAATLVFAATVGGGWTRLSAVEKQLARHDEFFQSIAVNQYLICRMVNKNASKDEKLKCAYPGGKPHAD